MNLQMLKGHTNSFVVMPVSPQSRQDLATSIAAVGGVLVSHRSALLEVLPEGQDDVYHDLSAEVALIERVARETEGRDIIFLVDTEWGLTKLSSEARHDLWQRALPPFGLRNLGRVVVYTALDSFLSDATCRLLRQAERLLHVEDLQPKGASA